MANPYTPLQLSGDLIQQGALAGNTLSGAIKGLSGSPIERLSGGAAGMGGRAVEDGFYPDEYEAGKVRDLSAQLPQQPSGALYNIGRTIDTGGRYMRSLIVGDPGGDVSGWDVLAYWMGDKRVTGKPEGRKYGSYSGWYDGFTRPTGSGWMPWNWDWMDIAALGVEVMADPLTYTMGGFGQLSKAGRIAKEVEKIERRAQGMGVLRFLTQESADKAAKRGGRVGLRGQVPVEGKPGWFTTRGGKEVRGTLNDTSLDLRRKASDLAKQVERDLKLAGNMRKSLEAAGKGALLKRGPNYRKVISGGYKGEGKWIEENAQEAIQDWWKHSHKELSAKWGDDIAGGWWEAAQKGWTKGDAWGAKPFTASSNIVKRAGAGIQQAVKREWSVLNKIASGELTRTNALMTIGVPALHGSGMQALITRPLAKLGKAATWIPAEKLGIPIFNTIYNSLNRYIKSSVLGKYNRAIHDVTMNVLGKEVSAEMNVIQNIFGMGGLDKKLTGKHLGAAVEHIMLRVMNVFVGQPIKYGLKKPYQGMGWIKRKLLKQHNWDDKKLEGLRDGIQYAMNKGLMDSNQLVAQLEEEIVKHLGPQAVAKAAQAATAKGVFKGDKLSSMLVQDAEQTAHLLGWDPRKGMTLEGLQQLLEASGNKALNEEDMIKGQDMIEKMKQYLAYHHGERHGITPAGKRVHGVGTKKGKYIDGTKVSEPVLTEKGAQETFLELQKDGQTWQRAKTHKAAWKDLMADAEFKELYEQMPMDVRDTVLKLYWAPIVVDPKTRGFAHMLRSELNKMAEKEMYMGLKSFFGVDHADSAMTRVMHLTEAAWTKNLPAKGSGGRQLFREKWQHRFDMGPSPSSIRKLVSNDDKLGVITNEQELMEFAKDIGAVSDDLWPVDGWLKGVLWYMPRMLSPEARKFLMSHADLFEAWQTGSRQTFKELDPSSNRFGNLRDIKDKLSNEIGLVEVMGTMTAATEDFFQRIVDNGGVWTRPDGSTVKMPKSIMEGKLFENDPIRAIGMRHMVSEQAQNSALFMQSAIYMFAKPLQRAAKGKAIMVSDAADRFGTRVSGGGAAAQRSGGRMADGIEEIVERELDGLNEADRVLREGVDDAARNADDDLQAAMDDGSWSPPTTNKDTPFDPADDPFGRGYPEGEPRGFPLMSSPDWNKSHLVKTWAQYGRAFDNLNEKQERRLAFQGFGEIDKSGKRLIPSVDEFKQISQSHNDFYQDLENSSVVQNGVIREGALSLIRMFFKDTEGSMMLNWARGAGQGRSILWDTMPETATQWGRAERLRMPRNEVLRQQILPETESVLRQQADVPGELAADVGDAGMVDVAGRQWANKPWDETGHKITLNERLSKTPIGFQTQVMMHELGHVLWKQQGRMHNSLRVQFSNYTKLFLAHKGSVKQLLRHYMGNYGKNVDAGFVGKEYDDWLERYADQVIENPDEMFSVLFANSFMRRRVPKELMQNPDAMRPLMSVYKKFFNRLGKMQETVVEQIKKKLPKQFHGSYEGPAMRRGMQMYSKEVKKLRQRYENIQLRVEARGTQPDGSYVYMSGEKDALATIEKKTRVYQKQIDDWSEKKWSQLLGPQDGKSVWDKGGDDAKRLYESIGEEGLYMVQMLDTIFESTAGLEDSFGELVTTAVKRRSQIWYSDTDVVKGRGDIARRRKALLAKYTNEEVESQLKANWKVLVHRHEDLSKALGMLRRERSRTVDRMKGIEPSKTLDLKLKIVDEIDRKIFVIEQRLDSYDAFKSEYDVLMDKDDPLRSILDSWKTTPVVRKPRDDMPHLTNNDIDLGLGKDDVALLHNITVQSGGLGSPTRMMSMREKMVTHMEINGELHPFEAEALRIKGLYKGESLAYHHPATLEEGVFGGQVRKKGRTKGSGPLYAATESWEGVPTIIPEAGPYKFLKGKKGDKLADRARFQGFNVKFSTPKINKPKGISASKWKAMSHEQRLKQGVVLDPGDQPYLAGKKKKFKRKPVKLRKMKELEATLKNYAKKKLQSLKKQGQLEVPERIDRTNKADGITQSDIDRYRLADKVSDEGYETLEGKLLEVEDVAQGDEGKRILDWIEQTDAHAKDASENFNKFLQSSHFPNQDVVGAAWYRLGNPSSKLSLKFDHVDVDNLFRYMRSDLIKGEFGKDSLVDAFPSGPMDTKMAGELRKWFLSAFEVLLGEKTIGAGMIKNRSLSQAQGRAKNIFGAETVSSKRAVEFSPDQVPERFYQFFEFLSAKGGNQKIESIDSWLSKYASSTAGRLEFEELVKVLSLARSGQMKHKATREAVKAMQRANPLPDFQDMHLLRWSHLPDSMKMDLMDEYLIDQGLNPAWVKSFILSRAGDPKWKVIAGQLVENDSFMWGPNGTLLKVQDLSHAAPGKKMRVKSVPDGMATVPGSIQERYDDGYMGVMDWLQKERDFGGHSPKRFVSSDEDFVVRGTRDAYGNVMPDTDSPMDMIKGGKSPDVLLREAADHGADRTAAFGPTQAEAVEAGWAQLDMLPTGEAPHPYMTANPPPLYPKIPSQTGSLNRTRAVQEAMEIEAVAVQSELRDFIAKLMRTSSLDHTGDTAMEKELQKMLKREDAIWEEVEALTPDAVIGDGVGASWQAFEVAARMQLEREGDTNAEKFLQKMADKHRHNLVVPPEGDDAIYNNVLNSDATLVFTRGRKRGAGVQAAADPLAQVMPELVPENYTIRSGGQGGIDLMAVAGASRGGFKTAGVLPFENLVDGVTASNKVPVPTPQYSTHQGAKDIHNRLNMVVGETAHPEGWFKPPKGAFEGQKKGMTYIERTFWNIYESDATVVFVINRKGMGSGSGATVRMAEDGKLPSKLSWMHNKKYAGQVKREGVEVGDLSPSDVKRPTLVIELDDNIFSSVDANVHKIRSFMQQYKDINFAGPRPSTLHPNWKPGQYEGDHYWKAKNVMEGVFGLPRSGPNTLTDDAGRAVNPQAPAAAPVTNVPAGSAPQGVPVGWQIVTLPDGKTAAYEATQGMVTNYTKTLKDYLEKIDKAVNTVKDIDDLLKKTGGKQEPHPGGPVRRDDMTTPPPTVRQVVDETTNGKTGWYYVEMESDNMGIKKGYIYVDKDKNLILDALNADGTRTKGTDNFQFTTQAYKGGKRQMKFAGGKGSFKFWLMLEEGVPKVRTKTGGMAEPTAADMRRNQLLEFRPGDMKTGPSDIENFQPTRTTAPAMTGEGTPQKTVLFQRYDKLSSAGKLDNDKFYVYFGLAGGTKRGAGKQARIAKSENAISLPSAASAKTKMRDIKGSETWTGALSSRVRPNNKEVIDNQLDSIVTLQREYGWPVVLPIDENDLIVMEHALHEDAPATYLYMMEQIRKKLKTTRRGKYEDSMLGAQTAEDISQKGSGAKTETQATGTAGVGGRRELAEQQLGGNAGEYYYQAKGYSGNVGGFITYDEQGIVRGVYGIGNSFRWVKIGETQKSAVDAWINGRAKVGRGKQLEGGRVWNPEQSKEIRKRLGTQLTGGVPRSTNMDDLAGDLKLGAFGDSGGPSTQIPTGRTPSAPATQNRMVRMATPELTGHGKGWITRKYAKDHPEMIFIWGDNIATSGRGGQAKELRGVDNAIGIPTKNDPGTGKYSYFTDADFARNKKFIDAAFSTVARRRDKMLVIPRDIPGSGRAQLEKRAPKTFQYIKDKIRKEWDARGGPPAGQPKSLSQFAQDVGEASKKGEIENLDPRVIKTNDDIERASQVGDPVQKEFGGVADSREQVLKYMQDNPDVGFDELSQKQRDLLLGDPDSKGYGTGDKIRRSRPGADSFVLRNLAIERDGGGWANKAIEAAEAAALMDGGRPIMHIELGSGVATPDHAIAIESFLRKHSAKRVNVVGESDQMMQRGVLGDGWQGHMEDILDDVWGPASGGHRLKQQFTDLQASIIGRTSTPQFREEARQFFIRLRAQKDRGLDLGPQQEDLYGKLEKLFPGYDKTELPPLPNWSPREEAMAAKLLMDVDPDRTLAPVGKWGTAQPALSEGLREWSGLKGIGKMAGKVGMPTRQLSAGEVWFPRMTEAKLIARTLELPQMGFPKSEEQIDELLSNMGSDSEFRYMMGQIADEAENYLQPGAGAQVPLGSAEHKGAELIAPERLHKGITNEDLARARGVSPDTWAEGSSPFETARHLRDASPMDEEQWFAGQHGFASLRDTPAEYLVRSAVEGGDVKRWMKDMYRHKPKEMPDELWEKSVEDLRDRMIEFRVNPVRAGLMEPGRIQGNEGLLQRGTWGKDIHEERMVFGEKGLQVPLEKYGMGQTGAEKMVAGRAAAMGVEPGKWSYKGVKIGKGAGEENWLPPGALTNSYDLPDKFRSPVNKSKGQTDVEGLLMDRGLVNYPQAMRVMQNMPPAFGGAIKNARALGDLHSYLYNNATHIPSDFWTFMMREIAAHPKYGELTKNWKLMPMNEARMVINRETGEVRTVVSHPQGLEQVPVRKGAGSGIGNANPKLQQQTMQTLEGQRVEAAAWQTANDPEGILTQTMGTPGGSTTISQGIPEHMTVPYVEGRGEITSWIDMQTGEPYYPRQGQLVRWEAPEDFDVKALTRGSKTHAEVKEKIRKYYGEQGEEVGGDAPGKISAREQGLHYLTKKGDKGFVPGRQQLMAPRAGPNLRWVPKSSSEKQWDELSIAIRTGNYGGVYIDDEMRQQLSKMTELHDPTKVVDPSAAYPSSRGVPEMFSGIGNAMAERAPVHGTGGGMGQGFQNPLQIEPSIFDPGGASEHFMQGGKAGLSDIKVDAAPLSGDAGQKIAAAYKKLIEYKTAGGGQRGRKGLEGSPDAHGHWMRDKASAADMKAHRNKLPDEQEQFIVGLARQIGDEPHAPLKAEMEETLRRRIMGIDTMADPEDAFDVSARQQLVGDGMVPWYDNSVFPDIDEMKAIRDSTDIRAFPEEHTAAQALSMRGTGEEALRWEGKTRRGKRDPMQVGPGGELDDLLGGSGSPLQLGPEHELKGVSWDEAQEYWRMEAGPLTDILPADAIEAGAKTAMPGGGSYKMLYEFAHESGLKTILHPTTGQHVQIGETLNATKRLFEQYGLGDYAMPASIHTDLIEAVKHWHSTPAMGQFLRGWGKMTSVVKASLTQFFPSFYIRNLFSDSMLSWISGAFDPTTFKDAFKMALNLDSPLETVTKKGLEGIEGHLGEEGLKGKRNVWQAKELAEQAQAGGAYQGGRGHQLMNELQNEQMTTEFGKAVSQITRSKAGQFANPESLTNKMLTFKWLWGQAVPKEFQPIVREMTFSKLTQLIERFTRSQHILARMRRGDSVLGAVEHARVHLLDYGDLSDFEKKYMQNTILFYSWTRKILPRLWDNFFKHPSRSAAAMRGTIQPSAKRDAIVPDWVRESAAVPAGGGYLYGTGSPFEELTKFDWTHSTPKEYQGLGDIISGVAESGGDMARKLMSQMHPVLKMGVEIPMGKDLFTKRNIAELDSLGSEWWLLNKVMPGAVTTQELPGGALRHRMNPWVNYFKNLPPWGRAIKELGGGSTGVLSAMFGDGDIDPKRTLTEQLVKFFSGVKFAPRKQMENLWAQEKYVTELIKGMETKGMAGEIPLYFPLGYEGMQPHQQKSIDLYIATIKALGKAKKRLRQNAGAGIQSRHLA